MGIVLIKLKFHINAALKKLFYKLSYGKHITFVKGTTFRKNFSLYIENNATVKIGNECFFNNGCSINALEKIIIGDRCIFGEGVKIYDQNHKFRDINQPVKSQGFSTKPIEIGSDCWICSNVIILKGVKIGKHCVIGAGCLVYKDVPDNTVLKNSCEMSYQSVTLSEENK